MSNHQRLDDSLEKRDGGAHSQQTVNGGSGTNDAFGDFMSVLMRVSGPVMPFFALILAVYKLSKCLSSAIKKA